MRYFITFLLILAVAGGVAWILLGEELLKSTGIQEPQKVPSESPMIPILDQLTLSSIRKIEVTPPGESTITLTRSEQNTWDQNGNWPVRQEVMNQLLHVLTGLHSRFVPIPLEGDAPDLKPYGLAADQKPVNIVVHGNNRAVTLAIGQPKLEPNETPFAQPTFLRVDNTAEVFRLGPDVYPIVARDSAAYRRRRLLSIDWVPLESSDSASSFAKQVPLLGDRYVSIRVEAESPEQPSYTLRRIESTPTPYSEDGKKPSALPADDLATAWELDTTVTKDGKTVATRDRVDPTKLRTILTGLADLWAEKFVDVSLEKAGFGPKQKPTHTLIFQRADGQTTTLEIGAVARTVTKSEPSPTPAQPFQPPPPPKVSTEEYRYARLVGNSLLFEIRTDSLTEVFAAPATLRDDQLARFDPKNVTAVTITRPGQPPITLTKKASDKPSSSSETPPDQWQVGTIPAESSTITDLITQLDGLKAAADDRVDAPDSAKLKELGLEPASLATITLQVQPKPSGSSGPKPRTIAIAFGKDDVEKKKLAAQVAGWPTVSLVDDAIVKLIERPALAYRQRRLFDTATAKLTTVSVTQPGGKVYALEETPIPGNPATKEWRLTAPIAMPTDPAKTESFTGDLVKLEAVEFVDDDPKPDDLQKKYGLSNPRYTVTLSFENGETRKLAIGAAREGTTQDYARLDGSDSVFTIPDSTLASLESGALALLPLEIWDTVSDRITAIEIRSGAPAGNEPYRLSLTGGVWKLTGPLDAPVGFPEVQPLLAEVASLKAVKYEALTAPDPAKYGFDKPELRLTLSYSEPKPNPVPGLPPDVPVTKTLIVGKPTASGASTRFARLDDPARPAVFVIADAIPTAADRPALGWLDKNLLKLDPARVVKVQIDGPKPENDVTLVRGDDGKWSAEGQKFPIDNATIADVVVTATQLPVARLAGYGANVDWSKYGLAMPTHTVTLTLKPAAVGGKPETHTLKLGKSETSGQRYLRVDEAPALGVLSAAVASDLTRDKLAFVDRSLFSFDPTTLTGITRTQGKDELALEQTGINWEITKPAKEKADTATLDELADRLSHLRATSVAAFDPKPADLAKYGLDKPAGVVTLNVGLENPTVKVLKLGKPVDDKKPDVGRYAIAVPADAKAPRIVAVLPGPLAEQLLAAPLAFRDKSLARFVDADKITLTRGERKATFSKVGGTWKLTAPITADAEQGAIDDLINTVARLRADELVADKPKDLKPYGLEPPEAVWTFFSGDKEVLKLNIGSAEKGSDRVYVQPANSNLVALLGVKASEQLTTEYRRREVFSDLDASTISSLAVSGSTGNFVFTKGRDGVWRDPAKPMEMLDDAKVIETLGTIATLKASPYVADQNAKVDLYGLKDPKRVIVVTTRMGLTKTLQLGGPVAGSNGKQVYARVVEPGRSDVFVVSAADTAPLMSDRLAYVKK